MNSQVDEVGRMGLEAVSSQREYFARLASIFSGVSMRRLIVAAVIICILAYPLIYFGNYAGDAQLHLVYGENAARGDFFEFNPGEKSPGVTSPGYMLVIAGLFKVFPDTWVPAVVKAVNLLFWYGLLLLVFLTARRLLGSTGWAGMAALAAGLLPGSVYNSTIGMENGIFAFVVFLWLYVAIRAKWFYGTSGDAGTLRIELFLGILMGLGAWLRPEGFVVAALALVYRGLLSLGSVDGFKVMLSRSLVFVTPLLALGAALGYFHYDQTGHLTPTSISSRILISNIADDTVKLGGFLFSPKFAIRLAQYFPMTILAIVGVWTLVTGRFKIPAGTRDISFLIILFLVYFVLYSTVLGSNSLSRYVIFLMPSLAIVAMVGGKWAWENWHPIGTPLLRRMKVAGACGLVVALAGVYIAETDVRLGLDSQASLWKSMKAPSERQAFSDAMFNRLGRPEELPISIALAEVQARYWLDERFVVRSLDGRVDPVLLDHADGVGVDHIGYFKEQQVRFLLDTPGYNRDPNRWSIKRLRKLTPGETLTREGLTFVSLPTGMQTTGSTMPKSSGGSRWTEGADGSTVLQWFIRDLISIRPEINKD